jgi:aspartate/methionine/tyrosine aminotransferase
MQLGVPCPRPAGGFYLYPDFSPWRDALLERGVRTSQELAHYLLEEWDIATLPGSVFGEEPLALRLRLSTSLLCEPEHGPSEEEREAALWNILDQAESLQSTGEKPGINLRLPALERAQVRLTEVIHTLASGR